MENQTQEYQEIDLHRAISALIEKKRLIFGVTVLGGIFALALGFVLPKVYRIDSSLEVGFIVDSEKPGPIENPIQVEGKIAKDVYGRRARQQLKISEKDYPKIKVENPKDTNIISLSVDSSKPDQAKQILETISDLIIAEHNDGMALMKKDIEGKIEIEKENIKRLENKIQSLDKEKILLEKKIVVLQQVNINNPEPGTEFVLLDNKEQLEIKKREIEGLYQNINLSQAAIKSLQVKNEQSKPTIAIKKPAISERPVWPRPALSSLLGALLGLIAGTLWVLGVNWWKNNDESGQSH